MSKSTLSVAIATLIVARLAAPSMVTSSVLPTATVSVATHEPGGTKADALLASSNPDQYAWNLFAYLNRQAKPGVAGVADESKAPFHEDKNTDMVWESWALASASDSNQAYDYSEVFLWNGSEPVPWEKLVRDKPTVKHLTPGHTGLPAGSAPMLAPVAQIPPFPSDLNNQEVRINQSSYNTIVASHLYSVEGIEKAVASAQSRNAIAFVAFPQNAKEVKAAWIHLVSCDNEAECTEKSQYHWRKVKVGASWQVWGLAAMHVMTKDLNTWFWADFIHKDCERKPPNPCAGYATGYASNPSDSTPANSETKSAAKGTLWENYILNGTQTGFLQNGANVELSNPVIEHTSSQPSSCMTCHAYGSAGLGPATPRQTGSIGGSLPNAGQPSAPGIPRQTLFFVPAGVARLSTAIGKLQFLQSDFEWSIIRQANHEVSSAHTAEANLPGAKSAMP